MSICRSLMRCNPNPPSQCSRPNCMICANQPSNLSCYSNNVGYRFVCDRQPCNMSTNMNKLQTKDLLKQLETSKPKHIPAIYEGQTFRSSYVRAGQHLDKYEARDPKSWMWTHATQFHNSTADNFQTDYKYVRLKKFRDNLTRQTNEGLRQTQLEHLQSKGKVRVMNSKLDFTRPFMTHLQVHSGSTNAIPGQPCPAQPRVTTQQPSKSCKTVRFNCRSKVVKPKPVRPYRQKRKPVRRKPVRKVVKQTNQAKQTNHATDHQAEPSQSNKRRASTPLDDMVHKRAKLILDLSSIPHSSAC